eukprot:674986-Alexandrium_andersonii.AAC.1
MSARAPSQRSLATSAGSASAGARAPASPGRARRLRRAPGLLVLCRPRAQAQPDPGQTRWRRR